MAYPHTRAAENNRNVEQAEVFARRIVPILELDTRFDGVRVSPAPDGGPTLDVRGWVETQADLAALQSLVESARPPVRVHWSVQRTDGVPAEARSPM